MATKFDEIETKLLEYRLKAIEYAKGYLEEFKEYMDSQDAFSLKNSELTDSFVRFSESDIYYYLVNGTSILHNEYLKRVNHYPQILASKKFKNLINELYADANKLYSLMDSNVILEKEQKKDYAFFANFYNVILSLNVANPPENKINYYSELVELLQDKSNFHFLQNFNHCDKDILDDEGSEIDGEDDFFNILSVIRQYDSLIQPFDNVFISKNHLIKYTQEYKTTKDTYKTNLEELKKILKQDLEKLRDFYLFHELVNCEFPDKYFIVPFEERACPACHKCRSSVLVVLTELINYVKAPNGIEFTNREKQILEFILEGYSTQQIANASTNEKTSKKITKSTVEKHINSILRKTNLNDTKDLLMKFG